MSYFTEMGKILAAEMAKQPAGRLAADRALKGHLARPMARDALPSATMRPRGPARDQEPEMPQQGAAPLDAAQCLSAIQQMLDMLPPDQHDALISALAEMIQEAHSESNNGNGGVNGDQGLPNNNLNAIDMRSRRPGRDNQMMRQPAQDAAITALYSKSFEARWSNLVGGVEVWNGFRR